MKKTFKKAAGKKTPVSLGLALQGGGSYGAFTKGVLKALLESDIIKKNQAEIKAVTGTSAGAVNGALLVEGLNTEGPQKAIENLDGLWDDLGRTGATTVGLTAMFNMMSGVRWPNVSKRALAMGRASTPKGYALKALRDMLDRQIDDWDAVRSGDAKLFVNAVSHDPQTDEVGHRIFSGEELNLDTIAASGALKELGAQVIDGVEYYDGAYWRNPSTCELDDEDISDLLVITIQSHPDGDIEAVHQDDLRDQLDNPGHEVLTSEIHHHLEFLNQNHKHINLHAISMVVDDAWDETSRMNPDPDWLNELEDMGYKAGQKWIKEHGDKLGRQSSYQMPCTKSPSRSCDCKPK